MNKRWKYEMMRNRLTGWLAGFFVGIILILPAGGQTTEPATKAAMARTRSAYKANQLPKRAGLYYSQIWGVDSLSVKSVESGELVRFSWRVLNADSAKPLNDKKLEPSLIDPRAGVSLVVPSLEKIGRLRQAPTTPEAGKSYWMAFSNKGRFVKRGDIVSVVIGSFRADGLVVQ